VSDVPDADDDIDWKAVVKRLRRGLTVEIPCAEERDYARRTKQVVKRAGKREITVAVHRGEGVLRVEPLLATSGTGEAQDVTADE
jgi:hypothetical protein